MTLEEFIALFADEFMETPVEEFAADTNYRQLPEWNSLTALSIISMVDDQLNKTITGADLRRCVTIEELYKFIETL